MLKPEDPATEVSELVAIQYGAFISISIKFVIVAWSMFIVVQLVNVIRRAESKRPPTETPPLPQEALLVEIRD